MLVCFISRRFFMSGVSMSLFLFFFHHHHHHQIVIKVNAIRSRNGGQDQRLCWSYVSFFSHHTLEFHRKFHHSWSRIYDLKTAWSRQQFVIKFKIFSRFSPFNCAKAFDCVFFYFWTKVKRHFHHRARKQHSVSHQQ